MKKSHRMKKLSLAATLAVVSSIACFAQEISDEIEQGAYDEVAQNYQAPTTTAQSGVLLKEAGAYQRKSVAFSNFVISKNEEIPEEWKNEFVSVLQNAVRLKRFDYNDIPSSTADKFFALPASLSIEDRMTKAVVPSVLAAVDAEKEIRALQLLSEQQQNSFITDKAKESGITEEDIKAVMNAAYIFAPIYNGYSDTSYIETYQEKYYYVDANGVKVAAYRTSTRKVYELYLQGGAYWWKIENDGQNPPYLKIIARIERSGGGKSYPDSTHKYPQGYQYAAFRGALPGLGEQIKNATLDIADFQYTGQILNKNPRNVVISLGRPEETAVDDKFRVYESREDESGNVTLKKRGWVMVKKVGEKAHGLDSTQSKAQIISGVPYVGAVVREMPHFPFDVKIGFGMNPFRMYDKKQNEHRLAFNREYLRLKEEFDDKDDKDVEEYGVFRRAVNKLKDEYLYDIQGLRVLKMYGPEIKFRQNLARSARSESGSQWWLNTGARFLFGKSSSDTAAYLRYHPDMNKSTWGQTYNSYTGKGDEWIEYEISGLGSIGAEISLNKKIFIRRLALAPELGFGFNWIWPSGMQEIDRYGEKVDEPTYDLSISQISLGLVSNMGVEFAFAPNFHIGGTVGYNVFTPGSNKWKTRWRRYSEDENNKEEYKNGPDVDSGDDLKTSGMTWSAYVSFTIPHNSAANRKREFVSE